MPNKGIEIYFAQSDTGASMSKSVHFGMTLGRVLEVLGNPNKEYHNNQSLFLNYLELGIDVMIKDELVHKIILHSNDIKMPQFCFYDRCYFEIDLERTVEEDAHDIQDSGIMTPPKKENSDVVLEQELVRHLNKIK